MGPVDAWGESFNVPGQLTISPDGKFAYVADKTSTLVLSRDLQSGGLTLVDAWVWGEASPGNGPLMDMSADGRFIYQTSEGGEITVLRRDARTGEISLVGRTNALANYLMDFALSPDGHQAYLTDNYSLRVFDRDPSTGLLTFRQKLKDGVDGVQMSEPGGMAVSADGRFIYVAAIGVQANHSAITQLARASNGKLTYVTQTPCTMCAPQDLELSSDGSRLYAAGGLTAFDVDKVSGALTYTGFGGPFTDPRDGLRGDGSFALTNDGKTAYGVDYYFDTLYQAPPDDPNPYAQKAYQDGDYGIRGMHHPGSVTISADGNFVYVPSGGNWVNSHPGTIAVFRRDPATGDLTFASRFVGASLDGRPVGSPPPSVKINDGASYTNDPNVTLTVDVPRSGLGLEISNDGGFDQSQQFQWAENARYQWTLATTGLDRLPKTVYVRSLEGGPVYTDDIVLDQTAPVVVSAQIVAGSRSRSLATAAHRRYLRVIARDRLSGVGRIQITTNRHHPGSWRRYRKRHVYAVAGGTLYVRVRDRAKNRSRWHRVAG